MQMELLIIGALVTIDLSNGQYVPPNLQYQAYIPPSFNYQALIPSMGPTPPTAAPEPAFTTTTTPKPITSPEPKPTTTTEAPATTTTTTQAAPTTTTSNAAFKVVESSIATPEAAATTTAPKQEATTACTGSPSSTTVGCTGQSSAATQPITAPPPTMGYEPPAPIEEKTHAPAEEQTTAAATQPPQHVVDTAASPIPQNYGVEPEHPEPTMTKLQTPVSLVSETMHSEAVTDGGHMPPNYGGEPTHPEAVVDKGYTPPSLSSEATHSGVVTDSGYLPPNYGIEPGHPEPVEPLSPSSEAAHPEPVTDNGHMPSNYGNFPDSSNAISEGESPAHTSVGETPSNTQEPALAPFTQEGELGGPPGSEPQPPDAETPGPKGTWNKAFPTILGGNYGSYANGGPAPKYVVDKPQKNKLTYGGSNGGYGFPPSPKSNTQAPTTTTTIPTTPTTTTSPTTTSTTTVTPTSTGVGSTPCPFSATTTTTQGPVKPPCPSLLYGAASKTENRGYDAKPLDSASHKDKMGRKEKRKPAMIFDAKDVALAPATNDDGHQSPGSNPDCRDNFAMCYLWALDGECDTNPFWMKPNCQLSCKSCGMALEDVEKPMPKKHENCTNKHELCQFWKKADECTRNEAYMRKYCPLSCDFC